MNEKTTEKKYQPRLTAANYRLLEKLTNACGVSGDEARIRKIVLEQVKPHADDVKVDAMGNVLVTCKGTRRNRLKVMLAAHMDEVGFMVISDEGKGFFRFDTVGGLDARHLVGKPVWVGANKIPGVIGAKPIHLTKATERKRSLTVDALRIDVSPGNKSKVKVGDRAAFATEYMRIGPSIRAKALDDRIGVATLIELVKNSPGNIDLMAAFTVQEEVGLRGAKVAAYTMEPDIAIAIDSTPAHDLPTWDDEENTRYNTRLGSGPAVYLADRATLSDPRLIGHLVETAERESIPYQFRQPGGGGTDAGAIHKQRAGIPSVSVSVPGRYAHTAAGIVRTEDWQNTIALLYRALETITPKILAEPR